MALALCALTTASIHADSGDRTISMFNIHTKERLTATFKRGGRFDDDALAEVNHFMRDWRIDETVKMDPKLVDLLWELHTELGSEQPIHLISGHRSEGTNDMLRQTRGGQAKKSLHIAGMAADVFFPDVPLERLRNAALVRERGGVGFYPSSGQPFVHVDTGRVRHWPAIPEAQLASIMAGKGDYTVPARAVSETRIALADAAPPPRLKPLLSDFDAEPLLVTSEGESNLLPSAREPVRMASAARDWGQSWLLPSALSVETRDKPSPVDAAGAARVVVTTPSSGGAVKGDAPLSAAIAIGYAGAGGEPGEGRGTNLLDNPSGDLARLLAEAQLIGGADSAEPGAPIDLRPAVLSHTRDELPSRPAAYQPAPVMTASLGPAIAPADLRAAHIAPVLATNLAWPAFSEPRERPQIDSGPELITALLTTPASDEARAFGFGAVDYRPAEVASFSRPAGNGGRAAPRIVANASDASGSVTGEIVGFAERAIGWIFGN